jgi:hypothetical protein
MVKSCVLFEVRAEFLNIIKTSFGFKGLSYNNFDYNTKISRHIFSDSEVGSNLSCRRAKPEALVASVLALSRDKDILEMRKEHNSFQFFGHDRCRLSSKVSGRQYSTFWPKL